MIGPIAVFLDANYVRRGAEELFGRRDPTVNWRGLADALLGGRALLRVYYYDALITKWNAPEVGRYSPEERKQKRAEFAQLVNKRYLSARNIARIPYFSARLAECRGRYPYTQQKGVDTKISLDMLDLSRRGAFRVAVLVSGDGDLAEVVERVTADGHHVELAHYAGSVSDRLRDAADISTILTRDFMAPFVQWPPHSAENAAAP